MQNSQSPEEDENVITIPIDQSFSDGDTSTWPTEARFGKPDDRVYREKLAVMWLKETGAYEQGMEYILDRLPEGYALFDRPRGSNPDIRDRFVWGHPVGQYFDSTIRFFPHFYHLMTGGTSPCSCVNCMKLKKRNNREKDGATKPGRPPGKPLGRPPGRPSGTPAGKQAKQVAKPTGRRPGRPLGWRPAPKIADKEGTPDVYKMAIIKLKTAGSVDQKIEQPASMDWRAERSRLLEYLEKLNMQPSYVPRPGEIVLWTPRLDGELAWNEDSNSLQIYSPDQDKWLGTPEWRAGVIGQVPEEDNILQDLVETATKAWEVNYSGFRVETFPDPNSTDKSYSLHSKYVHLRCIKPFNAFERFLQDIPRDRLHPSIEYALTIMSSFSLLDQYHIKGTWPNATVSCRGIFIGAELLVVGDAVRLKPQGSKAESAKMSTVTDVMVIDDIQLQLIQCIDDIKSEQLAENYRVRITGKIYTRRTLRAYMTGDKMQPLSAMTHDQVVDAFHHVGMGGYGEWYKVHSGKTVAISQDMILGRCYEPDAMKLLFGSIELGNELHGVLNARDYSRRTDQRIPEGKDWFWGDYRTQTLAIDSLNGEDVGKYNDARDVRMWRANLKVLDGNASQADLKDAKIPGDVGRPAAKAQSSFAEVRKTSTLVSTGLGADTSNNVSASSSSVEEEEEEEEEEISPPARKEASADEELEDEEEEEEDFSAPPPFVRGGTEETEGGDYVPDDEDERKLKKTKYN